MCSELTMMLDKVSSILPSIEAARPGCKAGIQELCNLYNVVEKGRLIIIHCIDCSKLYLVRCLDGKLSILISYVYYSHTFIFSLMILDIHDSGYYRRDDCSKM
jgi:hypothetical protein